MNEDVEYTAGFLSANLSTYYFEKLLKDIVWTNELKTIDGSTKKINRKMAYFFDRAIVYKYANFILPGYVWTDDLLELKYLVSSFVGKKFNSVLLNLYENGKDEIKWHSDNESILGDRPVIACLNLGSTRTFKMLRKSNGEKLDYSLSNGDLLVMKENCQRNWLHAILPEKGEIGPRISLTFRLVYDD